jgi:hypothetical protein
MMTCKILHVGIVSFILVSSIACTAPVLRDQEGAALIPPPSGVAEDRRVLAGEWDYEDGAVVTLTLDEQGNGTYPWKGGRFETRSLSDHTWEGMWFQTENDREGRFIVQLSPDFSDGEGRWWYTRIESDQTPTEKGGTFRLTRKTTLPALGETHFTHPGP